MATKMNHHDPDERERDALINIAIIVVILAMTFAVWYLFNA